MSAFGWDMPAGAEEKKDRLDQRDAKYLSSLEEEKEIQMEELYKKLEKGQKKAIHAVANQICRNRIVKICSSESNSPTMGAKILSLFIKAVEDAAEVAAIKKMEGRK